MAPDRSSAKEQRQCSAGANAGLYLGAILARKFDLTLSLGEHDSGVSGAAGYATDRFDAATIDRLIRHFERVLAGMVERPEPLPITRSTARSMPG